jgi:hypothetical protein
MKSNKEPTLQDQMHQNATTVNNQDIWLKIALNNKLKSLVSIAESLVISQKLAQKVTTERRTLNATNVMKTDISPEIAKVKFDII